MIKRKELSDPTSCLNKATGDEVIFVLLSRDEAAPETIRHWAYKRIALGENKMDDAQIMEAFAVASKMERQRLGIGYGD